MSLGSKILYLNIDQKEIFINAHFVPAFLHFYII